MRNKPGARKAAPAFDVLEARDVPATFDVYSVGSAGHASSNLTTDNDYTRLASAVGGLSSGDTLNLHGTFDWTESHAAASWALGNNGVNDGANYVDDYGLRIPSGLDNLTITAPSLGAATIMGPGDVGSVDLEGVFYFDGIGGTNQNTTISNLQIYNFDTSIYMVAGSGAANSFNGTQILNNHIIVPADANAVDFPADVSPNVGIQLGFGQNQLVQGNTVDLAGNGDSGTATGTSQAAASIGITTTTPGRSQNAYDGLVIQNNIINVVNAQSAHPESILGIWENAESYVDNITVKNNTFTNLAAGNDPTLNHEVAFRVTSHSNVALGKTVLYQGNSVTGASVGFEWNTVDSYDYAGLDAVQLVGNSIQNTNLGINVQNNGNAYLKDTTFSNTGAMAGKGIAVQASGNSSSTVPNAHSLATIDNNDGQTTFTGVNQIKNEIAPGQVVFLSPAIQFTTPLVSMTPGNSGQTIYQFTVSINGLFSGSATVNYATQNGTATTLNGDYVAASGTLTFTGTPSGTSTQTISVTVNGKPRSSDEDFYVNLTSPSGGAVVGSPAQADGHIVHTPNSTPSIQFSTGTTSVSPGTSGSTQAQFIVTITGLFTGGTATVNYATQNGTATTLSGDYTGKSGTLTFSGTPSGTSSQTIFVTVFGKPRTSDLTFSMNLTNATGGATIGSPSSETCTIIHSTSAPQIVFNPVTVSVSNSTIPAGGYDMPFTVTISPAPSTTVMVNYATQNGTATVLGGDYNSKSGQLTFTSTVTTATILVHINQKTGRTQNQSFYVNLTNPTGGATIGTPQATGTIIVPQLADTSAAKLPGTVPTITAVPPSLLEWAEMRWIAAGANPAAFRGVTATATKLSGNVLGQVSGRTIQIANDAAGYGWFVDATPWEDSEFGAAAAGDMKAAAGSAAAGRMDMLTVLDHELGHLLGLPDVPTTVPHQLMTVSLATGIRRLPTSALLPKPGKATESSLATAQAIQRVFTTSSAATMTPSVAAARNSVKSSVSSIASTTGDVGSAIDRLFADSAFETMLKTATGK
jgi:hypothetical protein